MHIDFHTHAVGHRYSYDGTVPNVLSPKDEGDIRNLIELGIARGLDAIAITDHDLALSGLWGKQFAAANKLPIRVIAGCECELYIQGHWVHLLALNLSRPLIYTPYTPIAELTAQIKEQGAVSILAHPMLYDIKAYHLLKDWIDGVEYRNGAAERRGYEAFTAILDSDSYTGLRLYNSDYHYPEKCCETQWQAWTEMDEPLFRIWFG